METTFSEPAWVRGYFRGWIELERGNAAEAITHLERASRAIHRDGYFPFTGVPLARAMIQTGQLDRAELYLNDVIAAPFPQPIEHFRARALLIEIEAHRARQHTN